MFSTSHREGKQQVAGRAAGLALGQAAPLLCASVTGRWEGARSTAAAALAAPWLEQFPEALLFLQQLSLIVATAEARKDLLKPPCKDLVLERRLGPPRRSDSTAFCPANE